MRLQSSIWDHCLLNLDFAVSVLHLSWENNEMHVSCWDIRFQTDVNLESLRSEVLEFQRRIIVWNCHLELLVK